MRVLMLGWEFPPFISGGLGTACYGLTRAMNRQGTEVLFVLPRAVQGEGPDHVRLISPPAADGSTTGAPGSDPEATARPQTYQLDELEHVTFKAVPSPVTSPYPSEAATTERRRGSAAAGAAAATEGESAARPAGESVGGSVLASGHYDADVVEAARRYAQRCIGLVRGERFDVIHAHDWMTFPAGLEVARQSGKPLIVHVHSTEFDRSGENIHSQIYEIERRGMHGAMTVVCVSYLTRNICVHRYGVPAEKVQVVYNGIETNGPIEHRATIRKGDKIVLFLGRITMQKGPEYFVAAAKRVLEKIDNVKFVMAGAGDMVRRVIEMAAEMGIGHRVLFTGFLRGKDVERIFRMADLYVMPSVSEPFGIAPLEAIRHDVPVIISRSSGVAEVLDHALKVDFWDVNDIANKIIAVLRHPPLSQTLREQADLEVRTLTWDGAAGKCLKVYQRAIQAMHQPSLPAS